MCFHYNEINWALYFIVSLLTVVTKLQDIRKPFPSKISAKEKREKKINLNEKFGLKCLYIFRKPQTAQKCRKKHVRTKPINA